MSKEEMFIIATRKKMRFPYKGMISVEDLWDLPVTELDKIYKSLNKKAKSAQEDSLLETTTEDEYLKIQIEIVRYVVSVKLDERKAAETAQERKEMEQRILAIKAQRANEKLENLSDEDLDKMLEDLK